MNPVKLQVFLGDVHAVEPVEDQVVDPFKDGVRIKTYSSTDRARSRMNFLLVTVQKELKAHAPFTALGSLSGIIILLITVSTSLSHSVMITIFWALHPAHVFLSALVTASVFRLHNKTGRWKVLIVGYVGSVGIATLSDSVIPYLGEWILGYQNRSIHLGFFEVWWLVNPLAVLGVCFALIWPRTKIPHAGHVLLSTWASLFHMLMAMENGISLISLASIFVFLFFAVWIPCCTSDIVFPLLFSSNRKRIQPDYSETSPQHSQAKL
jgi:hypothetical protein